MSELMSKLHILYILVSGPAVVVLKIKLVFCCCLKYILYGRLACLFGLLQCRQTKAVSCCCISHLLSWTPGWRKSYLCSGSLSLFLLEIWKWSKLYTLFLIYLADGAFWFSQDVDTGLLYHHIKFRTAGPALYIMRSESYHRFGYKEAQLWGGSVWKGGGSLGSKE